MKPIMYVLLGVMVFPIITVLFGVLSLGPGLIQSGMHVGGVVGVVEVLLGTGVCYGMYRVARRVYMEYKNR